MRKLEERFPRELVVVGVHSGKFTAERVTENVRRAVRRHGVHHPVVNDRRFRTWRAYAVNAWPTLTLIDPEGRVVGQQAGELTAEMLAPVVERVVREAEEAGTLDRSPRTFDIEREDAEGPLRFPAKLAVDEERRRLVVSDTGHHRVLIVRLDADGLAGTVEAVAGGGEPGMRDGTLDEAAFTEPHGIAVAGNDLYIADTGNHALRRIDRDRGRVETIAGPGGPAAGGSPLRSPWDLWWSGDALFVAMAGSHQLWRRDAATGRIEPWAGTGGEALRDGPRRDALLAQPSGLAGTADRIYFADSESSAIRWGDREAEGEVHTLVGTGLFDFGDRDGTGDDVRLQHPLDVALHGRRVYIADTYNGAIKVLDPERREVTTWLGGAAGLWEPGGMAVAGERMYIADTNHHRIVAADLGADRVEAVEIRQG